MSKNEESKMTDIRKQRDLARKRLELRPRPFGTWCDKFSIPKRPTDIECVEKERRIAAAMRKNSRFKKKMGNWD